MTTAPAPATSSPAPTLVDPAGLLSHVGDDVVYTMTDGKTERPAKLVMLDGTTGRATLAVFTAGDMDAGLIEHREREHLAGVGTQPPMVTRLDVPHLKSSRRQGDPVHSWRFRDETP
jgi:hypothetical protein